MRAVLAGIGIGIAVALAGCASPGGVMVREVGSFHVGGRTATLSGLPEKEAVFSPGAPPVRINPNGEFEVEQMYARYTLLVQPRAKYPLLMWHGGGLSGATFETKPDGRPGWEDWFLHAGHDVYVSDAVERGRSSWARYPEIFRSEPVFRAKKEGWELFRIGPAGSYADAAAQRQAWPGTLFPVEAYDQFTKQSVPRWLTNDEATQRAYDAYVDKVCPCVILVHSQGGAFAFNAALRAPDKIKAIVAVETSGTPDLDKTDYTRLRNTPIVWVWGDHLGDYPFWGTLRQRQETFRSRVLAAGGTADLIDLPQAGIRGNTHMVMMDRNSDEVAVLIQRWLEQHRLTK
jgi:pimeloyl-ACP methyl ester carboxylesterase